MLKKPRLRSRAMEVKKLICKKKVQQIKKKKSPVNKRSWSSDNDSEN